MPENAHALVLPKNHVGNLPQLPLPTKKPCQNCWPNILKTLTAQKATSILKTGNKKTGNKNLTLPLKMIKDRLLKWGYVRVIKATSIGGGQLLGRAQ